MPLPATAQLDRVLGVVRDVLDGAIAGAYLHGSTARDALRPRSDRLGPFTDHVLVEIRRA